jgi:hypothetical protein
MSLLSSCCVGGVLTDFYVRAGRGACGIGRVPAMSAHIETRCSYLYAASLGRPPRHAKVKGQAAVEEGAQGRGEESCRQIDPMPESVTAVKMAKQ